MSRSVAFLASMALVALVASGSPPASTRPATLRALYGLEPPRSIVSRTTALVLVDYQEEFFSGRLPIVDGRSAVARASELLAWARQHGVLVVHVRNVVTRPGSPVFGPTSPTTAFVKELSPRSGETVFTKASAGAFSKTELDTHLRAHRIDTIVVGGIMTHLAVDTTARDGAILGYRVIVAGDACATRALPAATDVGVVDAPAVHRVALASLADRFADVMTTHAIVTDLKTE